MENFTVQVPQEVDAGYGVWFELVFDFDDSLSEVDGAVYRIAPDTVEVFAGALCVVDRSGPTGYGHGRNAFGIPVENFARLEDLNTDDTHDFRTRLFDTEQDAREHLEYTLERWKNPEPWCNFIETGNLRYRY
jgi:hypothetical protein